jgi:ABC-type polysaccharide/polyol phosphate transport system ATPase subunit
VSFEIPEGQSFALIGANGCTTAQDREPDHSSPRGGPCPSRVGALIEVGTGCTPVPDGDVSLHGRILGLRGATSARFDQIVDCRVQAAIDRPVKQFSFGDAAQGLGF